MEIQNLVFLFVNKKLFSWYIHFILNWLKEHSFYNSGEENWSQVQMS